MNGLLWSRLPLDPLGLWLAGMNVFVSGCVVHCPFLWFLWFSIFFLTGRSLRLYFRWLGSSGLQSESSSGCLIPEKRLFHYSQFINEKRDALRHSPKSLQRLITALNVFNEKSTLQSRQRRSGSWTLSVLCIGVKCSTASAATPYWSKVLLVLVSHWLRAGHHNAWSDQSIAMSENKKKRGVQFMCYICTVAHIVFLSSISGFLTHRRVFFFSLSLILVWINIRLYMNVSVFFFQNPKGNIWLWTISWITQHVFVVWNCMFNIQPVTHLERV